MNNFKKSKRRKRNEENRDERGIGKTKEKGKNKRNEETNLVTERRNVAKRRMGK